MNVLVIMADALRADRLGCYGCGKDTSPTIDRLAGQGVRFDNCMAASTHTFPAVVSILSGLNVATHGLLTAQDYGVWFSQDTWKNRRTPIHVLTDAGFLADGEWVLQWRPVGFTRERNDLRAYLKENRNGKWFYFAAPYATHLPYNPPEQYYRMFLDRDFQPSTDTLERLHIARTAMICHPPGILSALEVGQPEPFPDEELDEAHQRTVATVEFQPEDAPGIRALYDGGVRAFDDWVAEHLALLEDLDLLDETLVVLMSDHGEELLERGHVGHASCNLSGTLFDECVRTPLIIRYPKRLPAGKIIDHQVSHIDLMPTILDLLGLDASVPMDGASLVPLIEGRTNQFRPEAYAGLPPAGWQRLISDQRLIWCVRTVEWKLILYVDPAKGTRRYELYNLGEDPGERRNLFDTHRDQADELKAKLDAHMASRPGA